MAKKKTKKKQPTAKEKRLSTIVILLYAFSLVLDGLFTALVLWPLEGGEKFFGAYGGYVFGSAVVGLITVFFACLTTKKSQPVRDRVIPCIITRGVVLLASDIVLMILNPTWSLNDGERAVGAGVVCIVLLGGISFGLQLLLCSWISDNLFYPPTPYVPTAAKHTGSEVSSSSSSHIIVTDAVKNTEFYKEAYDKEYRKLMGYPPKDNTSSDYSDLDDHDYSHIFRDKNF